MRRERLDGQVELWAVPSYGQVGAGKVVDFIPREETITVLVPKGLARPHEIGTLIVSGDSLTGDGIYNGDILVFRTNIHQRQITNETVCIVRIRTTNELLAKRFIRYANDRGQVALRSSGGNFPDRYFDADDIEIVGIVFAMQRLADDCGRLRRESLLPF